ncbi:MAG: acyltransferase [Prevotellaceae bacterium]|jgi:hypothetical protein|nr:acyltransferase [Prevotellaceae bacterium]
MKERNISIDILRFFAAILITNSHMDVLYHPYEFLGTGGAIGDALFFFASGFTLFLGEMRRFDNYYKRRINRIYPTVFSWALIASIFFLDSANMKTVIFTGGGWFVSCIMIYYIILYFIRKYMYNHLILAFGLASAIVLTWYFFEDKTTVFMYGGGRSTFFGWGHYFLFMLLGAILGSTKKQWNFVFKKDILKLVLCTIVYYAILAIADKYEKVTKFQILSLLPLLGTIFYFYKICNSKLLKKIYYSKFNKMIVLISMLCLEIYVVQGTLLTDKMNALFPFNIVIMFTIIVICAYAVKVLSRIFSQIFMDAPFNWNAIFQIKN